jgi:uncharacterized membrane protein YdbT with pleckstrin-like domain
MIGTEPTLISGERVAYTSRKHWASVITRSGWAIGMIVVAIVLGWLQTEATSGVLGFFNRTLALLQLGFFLGGLGWIIYNVVAWRTATFTVTNRRVLGQEGLIQRRSTDVLLTSVADIRTVTSLLGRSLNYGNVRIMTAAGESGRESLTAIRNAEEFKHQVLEQKAGRAATAERAPAPPAAATGVDGPVDVGQEVAQLLGSLGRLNRAGVLSDAEYATLRADFLRRV